MSNNRANVQNQFNLRADVFNVSAHWITDENLLQAHIDTVGANKGKGLELCCGTGVVGKRLTELGWDMTGVDITQGMIDITSKYFKAIRHNVEGPLPFEDNSFDLVIMRQALFFFEPEILLKQIKRVLRKDGQFVLSQTVPFLDSEDENYLREVHLLKQAQMLKFYTSKEMRTELEKSGLKVSEENYHIVRESITKWMKYAPEMEPERSKKVTDLIKNIPNNLQKYREVKEEDGELLENWNWVIFKAEI